MSGAALCWWSAGEVAAAVRNKTVSPVEVVTAHLERIARVNPALNSYVTVLERDALDAAHAMESQLAQGRPGGVLAGVPVSLKDMVFMKGVRTTAGSRAYATFTPDADAVIVQRLRDAGAIILGKTNTSEFGYKPVTDNALFGPTRNPWDLTRSPGGSSGGSAAAVAAGLSPISIGTDGGGSIRIPSALCGVVGLKPSRARVPQLPGFPGWDLLGHTGPLARTATDIELVMRVIAGPSAQDPSSVSAPSPRTERRTLDALRVGVATAVHGVSAEAEIVDAVKAAARALTGLGCRVEEVAMPWEDPIEAFRVLMATDLAAALEGDLAGGAPSLEPAFAKFLQLGLRTSAIDYVKAHEWRRGFQRRVLGWFESFDLLVTPTSPVPAFPIGGWGPREIGGAPVSPIAWIGFAYPFNVTGQPAISVPAGRTTAGLPIGVQIVGYPGDDELIVRAAQALEAALAPNGHPRPPDSEVK